MSSLSNETKAAHLYAQTGLMNLRLILEQSGHDDLKNDVEEILIQLNVVRGKTFQREVLR